MLGCRLSRTDDLRTGPGSVGPVDGVVTDHSFLPVRHTDVYFLYNLTNKIIGKEFFIALERVKTPRGSNSSPLPLSPLADAASFIPHIYSPYLFFFPSWKPDFTQMAKSPTQGPRPLPPSTASIDQGDLDKSC